MTNNILLNSTDLGVGKQMEPNMIEWRKSSKAILTIHADGRITVSEDCKPTATAAEVLRIMRDQWLSDVQCAKIRELQSNLNESNELIEHLRDKIKRMESFINRFLDHDDHVGYEVGSVTRDDAREALGRERVETKA